ncbi:hypothetical protein K474DRAFT_104740 [Panus rudis PR-1116 ss-1]|nr:hypothetical protein K474DRAFT_104740 [Panus rudis PR-1116 ss-1]
MNDSSSFAQIPLTFEVGTHGSECPGDLMDFLNTRLAHLNNLNLKAEGQGSRPMWKQVLQGLTQVTLRRFPSAQEMPWEAMHETIGLTNMGFLVVTALACRRDLNAVFHDDLSKDLVMRILNVITVLDTWLDESVQDHPQYPSPAELQKTARNTGTTILRCLGTAPAAPDTEYFQPTWSFLRAILDECAALGEVRSVVCRQYAELSSICLSFSLA